MLNQVELRSHVHGIVRLDAVYTPTIALTLLVMRHRVVHSKPVCRWVSSPAVLSFDNVVYLPDETLPPVLLATIFAI